jgi:hypothetical protein
MPVGCYKLQIFAERMEAKAAGNTTMSELLKLWMNALFGKMLQDDQRFRDVHFAFTDEDVLRIVDSSNDLLTGFDQLRFGDAARLSSKYIGPDKQQDLYVTTLAPIGVAVLAYARLYMAMFLNDLSHCSPGAFLLYTDTDSFYVAFPSEQDYADAAFVLDRFAGDKKLMQFKPEVGENDIISFAATTPKVYALQLRREAFKEGGEGPDRVCKYKIKGVTLTYNSHLLDFESYCKQIFDPDAEPLVGSAVGLCQRAPLQIYTQGTEKTVLTNHLTKRGWLKENPAVTFPHGHAMLKED